jgi:hypothetical protein
LMDPSSWSVGNDATHLQSNRRKLWSAVCPQMAKEMVRRWLKDRSVRARQGYTEEKGSADKRGGREDMRVEGGVRNK